MSALAGGFTPSAAVRADPAHAKELVIVGLTATGVIAAIGQVGKTNGLPSSRIGYGVFIAMALLSLMAEFAPEVAATFAMLILATSLFVYGGPAFELLAKLTGTTTAKTYAGAGYTPPGSSTGNHPMGPYLPTPGSD